MPGRSRSGEAISARPGPICCHRDSTTGSGDCGNTTSLIARPGSCRETSTCASWCSRNQTDPPHRKSLCTFADRALRSCQVQQTGKDFPDMTINKDVVAAIGNTPLIKLKRASEETGCTILGKAEFMNPGQSVKDRAGKWMILEAEKRGDLKPGGLVVESTAGNTGIGLAVVASARGYRTLILIPNTQSQEKKDMLRLCGAELVEVPALPYSNPNNYQHVGRRLADKLRKTEPN